MKEILLPIDLMKQDMEKLTFVNWDRFVVSVKEKKIDVYGWIKREDAHEDFVLLEYINTSTHLWKVAYSTSSKEFDKTIFNLLECDEEEPNKCERVEDFFEIKNMIKLKDAIPEKSGGQNEE